MRKVGTRRWVSIGIALGIFLSALDTSIVGTAMPSVIAALGGTEIYSWVFAAYMLTYTAASPMFGKLSDMFGQKRLFAIAIGIFLLGSALSGYAQTMPQLIVFRAIQGIGGGGLQAMAYTIVGHIFSPTERPKMQGVISAMWAISSIAGPGVGGVIVDHVSWRWVFYVNIPLGIIPVALVLAHLKDVRHSSAKPAIDFAGAALLSGFVVSLLFAFLQVSTAGWRDPGILSLFALAVALFVGLAWNESRVAQPIIPLALFRIRAFTVCNVGNLLTGGATFGLIAVIPLFVQGVLRGSATNAGFALMPLSIGWPIGSVLSGQTVNRVGYRNMALIGTVIVLGSFWLLMGMGADSTVFEIARNVFFTGLGMGLLTPTVTVAIQNAVPRAYMGVASSSVIFYRTIGGTVGVGIMGAVLNSGMTDWTRRLVDPDIARSLAAGLGTDLADSQVLLRPELSNSLPPQVLASLQQALTNSLHGVFVGAFAVLVIGLVIFALVPNSTPSKDAERLAALERSAGT